MTSVDALIDNSTLYNYVLEAFGLDPAMESKSKIRQVLVSDASDPDQLRQPPARTRAIAILPPPSTSRPTARCCSRARPRRKPKSWQPSSSTTRASATANPRQRAATEENTYYHNTISRVRSLDDFLADKRLVAYVLKAYGLEGEQISNDVLRSALTSDPLDQDSFVNEQADSGCGDLAAAFNFTPDGNDRPRSGPGRLQTRAAS